MSEYWVVPEFTSSNKIGEELDLEIKRAMEESNKLTDWPCVDVYVGPKKPKKKKKSRTEKKAFCFDDLHPDIKAFLMKYVPNAVNSTSLDELLLMLDDFITSTFDENDESTTLSREGEAVYDILYCCTP